jgi:hypothetical protein
MVHLNYTASRIAVALAQCIITSIVLEAASGVIAMLISSLTGPSMKCGSTSCVQPEFRAVHRSARSSICQCVNILALAHTGNVLHSSLGARSLRLRREPADNVRRIQRPVRRSKYCTSISTSSLDGVRWNYIKKFGLGNYFSSWKFRNDCEVMSMSMEHFYGFLRFALHTSLP